MYNCRVVQRQRREAVAQLSHLEDEMLEPNLVGIWRPPQQKQQQPVLSVLSLLSSLAVLAVENGRLSCGTTVHIWEPRVLSRLYQLLSSYGCTG